MYLTCITTIVYQVCASFEVFACMNMRSDFFFFTCFSDRVKTEKSCKAMYCSIQSVWCKSIRGGEEGLHFWTSHSCHGSEMIEVAW